MLKIETSLKRLPEKKYVLQVILKDLLGLEFEVHTTTSSGLRISRSDQKEVNLSDHFFEVADNAWLESESLPATPLQVWHTHDAELKNALTEPNLPILYGRLNRDGEWLSDDEKKIFVGLDVFGSAFFLLSDYENAVSKDCDKHGRFLGRHSVATRGKFIHRPIVQEYAELLWWALYKLWPDLRRKPFNFKVLPSHDVDNPYEYLLTSTKSLTRILAGDILKRHSLSAALNRTKTFIQVKRGKQKDPFDTFDWLMETSEKYNLVSTFNFMAAKPSPYNMGYSPFDPSIQSLMKKVDQRGHLIGFHPGYESSENEHVWFSEYERLSKASPQPIKVGRQHYLRFRPICTWRHWAQIGAAYESSLAYPDIAGFRGGMVRDFQSFDLEQRKPLVLRIQPLMLMDSTLLGYMGLDKIEAFEYTQKIINICRKYAGELTILWHNSDSVNLTERQLYETIIKSAIEGCRPNSKPTS